MATVPPASPRHTLAASDRLRPEDTIAAVVSVAVELSAAQIERIAERAAALLAGSQPEREAPSEFLSIREAAELLRCRRQRIDDILSQGRLTRFKDGGRTLVSRAELYDRLEGRRYQSRKTGSGKSSGTR